MALVTVAGCGNDSDRRGSNSTQEPPSALDMPPATANYITDHPSSETFALVADGAASTLVVSSADAPGVVRVVDDLRADIERVTRVAPSIAKDAVPTTTTQVVLIGTLGKSPLIDTLASSGKLDVHDIVGKWETSLIQAVDNPMDGVDRALVIAGSDPRGTIFGVYDVSAKIGVSPWYYWDDVPARQASALYVLPGRYSQGEPAVRYRGFFINDENPATGTWAAKMFGPGLAEVTRAGTGETTRYTGGLNHWYWEKVFEVALRLKANYIWPGVWGRAFADDDPENHTTASRFGIVMGTSHEAPMMRGIEEWNRRVDPTTRVNAGVDDTITHQGKDDFSPSGNGEWRYSTNAESLRAYFSEGIKRMVDQNIEGVVTLGMRGPGDVRLPPDTGIPLLQRIIDDQRAIIAQVTGKDAASVPQVWTLYKEVQNWWDQGLRVPDDVTVVWCDDNWGNIRELPQSFEPPRAGGYGLYYHFDYVGGGRSYKWVDTNLLPNIWEQLHLAYARGVDRVWMFNVGDMKNNELPLSFVLDFAWNPQRMSLENLPQWERSWAEQQFGTAQAQSIASILHTYGNLQSARKPELLNRKITLDPTKDATVDASAILYSDGSYFAKDAAGVLLPPEARTYYDANPFSLTNYGEMEQVASAWQTLATSAERVRELLPREYQDAYFELVLYQVQATANLYQLRLAEFQNILYASQQRAATNDSAQTARERFDDDQSMSNYYNTVLANGKWSGWQTQPHIGYGDQDRYGGNAQWQQPQLNEQAIPDDIFPALRSIALPSGAAMGVAIDGSAAAWPAATTPAVLPTFSPFQTENTQYIEIFSRGSAPFDYQVSIVAPTGSSNGNTYALPWIFVTPKAGTIDTAHKQTRALVSVDWPHAPASPEPIPVTFKISATDDANTIVEVNAMLEVPTLPDFRSARFVEANGVVSMQADHYSRAVSADSVSWRRIPDIGRNGPGVTPEPNDAQSQSPGGSSPHLEYDMYLLQGGDVSVYAYLSPRNSALANGGLRYAISIDDGPIQTVNINAGDDLTSGGNRAWERHTSDNVNLTSTRHKVDAPGTHVLKLWMVDPTIIVQKLVVDAGGLRDSYFGPPESYRSSD